MSEINYEKEAARLLKYINDRKGLINIKAIEIASGMPVNSFNKMNWENTTKGKNYRIQDEYIPGLIQTMKKLGYK